MCKGPEAVREVLTLASLIASPFHEPQDSADTFPLLLKVAEIALLSTKGVKISNCGWEFLATACTLSSESHQLEFQINPHLNGLIGQKEFPVLMNMWAHLPSPRKSQKSILLCN